METIDRWRKPDVESNTPLGFYAIWYGPGGADGECATMIEYVAPGQWRVSEWQDVRGPIDEPQARFLVTQTWLDFADVSADPRLAVARGVESLAEMGGEEAWAHELPR